MFWSCDAVFFAIFFKACRVFPTFLPWFSTVPSDGRCCQADDTDSFITWNIGSEHSDPAGFPLYFDIEIQGHSSCIFNDQFSTDVYSMDSITAIFNVYFCDDGTVLPDKKLKWQLLANVLLGNIPGRLKGHVDKKHDNNNDIRQSISTF